VPFRNKLSTGLNDITNRGQCIRIIVPTNDVCIKLSDSSLTSRKTQDRQYALNVTLTRVRVTVVVMK